jgi:hypothetical protein
MRLHAKSTNRLLRHLKRRTLAPRQSDAYQGKSATMHFQCGFPTVLNWRTTGAAHTAFHLYRACSIASLCVCTAADTLRAPHYV